MHIGDTLSLTLSENDSTGYMWFFTAPPAGILPPPGAIYETVLNEYIAPKAGSSPGTAGQRYLQIQAVGDGETDLKMVYAPAWLFKGFNNLNNAWTTYTIELEVSQ